MTVFRAFSSTLVRADHCSHLTQRLDSVFAVALSPTNPDLAASGGGDDKAFLWNIRNGEKLHELKGA